MPNDVQDHLQQHMHTVQSASAQEWREAVQRIGFALSPLPVTINDPSVSRRLRVLFRGAPQHWRASALPLQLQRQDRPRPVAPSPHSRLIHLGHPTPQVSRRLEEGAQ